jgi:uncharacterized protein with gpF-like domain
MLNNDERRELSAQYERYIQRFERKYAKEINSLLNSQFEQVAKILESKGFVAAKHAASHMLFSPALTSILKNLYKEVGLYVAKKTDQQIHQLLPRKKTGRIGFNARWLRDILRYFNNQALNLTTNINQTTRDRIEQVLEEAQREGWGIEQTARELRGDEINMPRARLIARTETAKAANVARTSAVSNVGFEMSKQWIATLDLRTRFTHRVLDGTVIDEDDLFNVGGYDAQGPGDDTLPPEEVCNCRCTMAFVPKRNAAGRLIPKQTN